MEITKEHIEKSLEMYRFIVPNTNAIILWKSGDLVIPGRVYMYCVNNKCQAIWMDFDNLTEAKLKRIYKKINILPFEFFMYYNGSRVRIGWKVKKTII